MANLTITIDDALLREYLVAYAGSAQLQERALADLLELSTSATSRRGAATWTRDELHEREAPPRRDTGR